MSAGDWFGRQDEDFRDNAIGKARLVGTFAEIPHPVAIEVMAQARPDFICIDWEHGQIARDQIENLVRACDVHGVPAMVRVPGHAPEEIAAALDSGARGILVPRVSTAAQAAAVVKASRYPPQGERGVGPGRATGYGYRIFDYLAEANASIVVAVQVETARRPRQCRRHRGDRRRRRGVRRAGRPVRVARRLAAGRRAKTRQGDREDHRSDAEARQDSRHLLRQAGGCRQMGGKGRELLHPGQRHDVSRRRHGGRAGRGAQRR